MSFYKEYISNPFRAFIDTFKNKKLLTIIALDILFYIIFFIGGAAFLSFVKKAVLTLSGLNLGILQDLSNVDVNAANQLLGKLQIFLAYIIIDTLLFILFIIITLTLIKGYEWGKIVNKKMDLSAYFRLFILNIIWFIIWIIIFIIPFSFVQKEVYLKQIYMLFPPAIYFTTFLYLNYAETNRIGKALKASFVEGILRIYNYITPLIIMALAFIIPFTLLKALRLQNKTLHLIIFLIMGIIILAVYKLYFYQIKKNSYGG